MFLAANIFDKMIFHEWESILKQDCPDKLMTNLAVTSLLVAVKLEESTPPNFYNIINLLKDIEIENVSRENLISLER